MVAVAGRSCWEYRKQCCSLAQDCTPETSKLKHCAQQCMHMQPRLGEGKMLRHFAAGPAARPASAQPDIDALAFRSPLPDGTCFARFWDDRHMQHYMNMLV